ncbi:hypothetical protein PG995_004204 [Apiospora arundinis]|uniref:Uncharacterized protein n=1 Tax=Apiospora arundinis TaxID=335852 RepID=A0ABR2HQ56_9PEZI
MFLHKYHSVPLTEDAADSRGRLVTRPRTLLILTFAFLFIHAVEITLFFTLGAHHGRCTVNADADQTLERYQSLQEYTHLTDFEMIFRKEDLDARVRNFTYWRNLFPAAQGLVSIPHDSPLIRPNVDTAPSALDETHSVYQVSVFHTLHCLEALKVALDGTASDYGITEDLFRIHAPHCIDWIRQEVMCSADITLDSILDGAKTPHQCRDFDGIFQWTEERGYRGSIRDILHHKLESAA